MATVEDTKIALKKKIHFQWTSTQEEYEKTIDFIVDTICPVCADTITERIKKDKMSPEERKKYEKDLAEKIKRSHA